MLKVRRTMLLAAAVFLVGCASDCIIDSEPRGAMIRIDGEQIGRTPVTFGFSESGFRTSYAVEASMDGYDKELQVVSKQAASFWATPAWPTTLLLRLHKSER